jgi:hypothetical protein
MEKSQLTVYRIIEIIRKLEKWSLSNLIKANNTW